MSIPGLIERLIKAAHQKGGERLELLSGKPAVMVSGNTYLQAGNAVIDGQGLTQWLEGVLDPQRWVSFELGEEVATVTELGGEPHALRASRNDGFVKVVLDLTIAPPAPQPTSPVPEAGSLPAAARTLPVPEPGSEPEAAKARSGPVSLDRPLDRMLRELVRLGGSDLHLGASLPPMIRLHGDMVALKEFPSPLSSEHILLMCDEIAPGPNRSEFRTDNDTDLAYEIAGTARFRVNLFRDRRGVGAVFRQIPHKILNFEDLGLPECAKNLCMLHKGLVLVTGPTGSGKSTTLATMIDYVNEKRSDHIITIEDPIEFVHENKRCLINQREVYNHTGSFKRALRAALREDPDVVLVGELRDLETMAIAIETAETGHLVFGTLHTTSAVSTVDRLIDQFPPDRQAQIRVMLAESLKGVIAQILLKRVGGGRVAAYEILLGVPAISNLVREGKTFQIPTIMQTGKRLGMRTMNDSLAELVRSNQVEAQEALSKAVDKDGLRALLKIEQ